MPEKELLHSRKILPEVEWRIKKEKKKPAEKREKIDVIMSKKDDVNIGDLVKELVSRGVDEDDIKNTDFFISVKLDPEKIEEIGDKKEGIDAIAKIWYNKKTGAFLDISGDTTKATPARNVFNVKGEGIVWAVIDTGISTENSCIKDAVVERFDFTGEGTGDKNGHGTHVAGIIASRSEKYPGIAPEAKLYDLKVLDENGEGTEFGAIEAMHKIREINFNKTKLVVHGANISLGSSVEVGSYGCGASPVCQEANRLVNSGVLVCVAAGNEGHKTIASFSTPTEIELFRTFIDLAISDPGNAENVITVGSVHKENPHTYGISYFSSKGPTGDGRYKPDVVAPGEKIKSLGLNEEDDVAMSGTSMAAPHVSGALALFLSVKKEFIGHPLKVKEILMQTCTDLKRDRYFQGAGLIDIFRAIQAV